MALMKLIDSWSLNKPICIKKKHVFEISKLLNIFDTDDKRKQQSNKII